MINVNKCIIMLWCASPCVTSLTQTNNNKQSVMAAAAAQQRGFKLPWDTIRSSFCLDGNFCEVRLVLCLGCVAAWVWFILLPIHLTVG